MSKPRKWHIPAAKLVHLISQEKREHHQKNQYELVEESACQKPIKKSSLDRCLPIMEARVTNVGITFSLFLISHQLPLLLLHNYYVWNLQSYNTLIKHNYPYEHQYMCACTCDYLQPLFIQDMWFLFIFTRPHLR